MQVKFLIQQVLIPAIVQDADTSAGVDAGVHECGVAAENARDRADAFLVAQPE